MIHQHVLIKSQPYIKHKTRNWFVKRCTCDFRLKDATYIIVKLPVLLCIATHSITFDLKSFSKTANLKLFQDQTNILIKCHNNLLLIMIDESIALGIKSTFLPCHVHPFSTFQVKKQAQKKFRNKHWSTEVRYKTTIKSTIKSKIK